MREAQQLKKVVAKKEERIVFVKFNGKIIDSIRSNELVSVIESAVGLYYEIKAIQPSLQEYKSSIFEVAKKYLEDKTTITLETDSGYEVKLTTRDEIGIDENTIEELKKILGDKFNEMVKMKIQYKPTEELIQLACDADSPIAEAIRKCLVINYRSPNFQFKRP